MVCNLPRSAFFLSGAGVTVTPAFCENQESFHFFKVWKSIYVANTCERPSCKVFSVGCKSNFILYFLCVESFHYNMFCIFKGDYTFYSILETSFYLTRKIYIVPLLTYFSFSYFPHFI